MTGIKNKDIAGTLKSWIKTSKFSQKDVAVKLGIAPSVLSRQLQGRESIPVTRIGEIGALLSIPQQEINDLNIKAQLENGPQFVYSQKQVEMEEIAHQIRLKNCINKKDRSELTIRKPNKCQLIDYHDAGIYIEISIPPDIETKELTFKTIAPSLHEIMKLLLKAIKN